MYKDKFWRQSLTELNAYFDCPTFFSQIGNLVPWMRMVVASLRTPSESVSPLYLAANWACLYVTVATELDNGDTRHKQNAEKPTMHCSSVLARLTKH